MIEQRELIPGEPAPSALEEAKNDEKKLDVKSSTRNSPDDVDEPEKESSDSR